MNIASNPKAVHAPLGAYTHTIKVPKDATWLVLAGQVGVDPKGRLAEGFRKQAEQTFRNILAGLREHGMSKKDLVKFTIYLTDSRFIEEYRAVRRRVLGNDTRPTGTLLIVGGLADPGMLIEIEAWAAKS